MFEHDNKYRFDFFKKIPKAPLVRKSILVGVGAGLVILIHGFSLFVYPRHTLVKELFFDPPYVLQVDSQQPIKS